MKWAHWKLLYLAAGTLVTLAIAYALDFTRRQRLFEKLGHAPQLQRMAASVSNGRRAVKSVLVVAAATLLVLSLAQPQTAGKPRFTERGIDVTLVMDVSKSMLATDTHPSRIEHAKQLADQLIEWIRHQPGNRVGVVTFAGAAVHFPLTTDYDAASMMFEGIEPQDLVPGSDIGEAILNGRCLLTTDDATDPDCRRVRGGGGGGALDDDETPITSGYAGDRARAMIVFTDGEDTEGHAKAEVEKAAKLGIDVYLVGIGTKQGDKIPIYDEEGRRTGWVIGPDGNSFYVTRLDEAALKELAQSAGGGDHYFQDAPGQVDAMTVQLGKLKEGDLRSSAKNDIPGEAFQFLLFPAFMALVIEACVSERRRRAARKEVRA